MSGASSPPDDTVSLVVGGQSLEGWQNITIQRGLEQMPASFDLLVTERYPTQIGEVVVLPGDECQVKIGQDLVITGYVDRYIAGATPRGHAVRVQGRSKCQDLVDCAAQLPPNNQINGTTTLDLAQKLAQPYGITVTAPDGPGVGIPWFDVMLGETVYEIIERVARYSALLVYDGTDGNLILAQAGTGRMASGFAMGQDGNVEAGNVVLSMDQRFSEYLVFSMTVNPLSENGPLQPVARATDAGVPRFRQRIIISEQIANGVDIARQRAEWEMARRYGRSQAVTVTCDSWRDAAGKLWEPNARASVRLPPLKVQDADWVIGQVTYARGMEGRHAEVTLMPVEAFSPQPQVLQMFDTQLYNALRDGAGAGGGGGEG